MAKEYEKNWWRMELRKLKTKEKKVHKNGITNNVKISDIYKAKPRTLGIVYMLRSFILNHRMLWNDSNTYLKPWLKGILTSVSNKLEKFVYEYGEITSDSDIEALNNASNYNKGVILGVFEKNNVEKIILEINNGERNINFEIFKTFVLLKSTMLSLDLDASVMAIFHRDAKQKLNAIIKELSIYIKWWDKEVEKIEISD